MKYRNPVIPGYHPDPSVCRAGEDYYLVTSSNEYFPAVPIYHSKDLVHWRQIGHVLTRESQVPLHKVHSSSGIYAPTIRYHDGRFYVATTNMKYGGNFYVWAEDPAGPWSDPIYVDQGGIDPSFFFDDDGKVYFVTNESDDEGAAMRQCEIDIVTGERLTDARILWRGTGGAYPEAPHLYKVNDVYYLLISEGGTEYGHMVTIARSKAPYGPFEPCPNNPIFTHRSLRHNIHATGHADFVQAHDGSWWAVFLGIRPVDYPFRHHLGRETFLAPVRWNEDGWPVIGNDGTVELEMEAKTLPPVEWPNPPERDDFDHSRLAPYWNFRRNPRDEDWSLTTRPGWLTLNGSVVTLNDTDSPAFVGRRQQHFHIDVSTLLDFEPEHDGEEAGLTIFMNERFHYEIAVTRVEGRKSVIFRRKLGTLVKVEYCEPCGEGPIQLSVSSIPQKYTFSYTESGKAARIVGEGEAAMLATEVAGGFNGVFIGMYATGNGETCRSAAHFDWFDYAVTQE